MVRFALLCVPALVLCLPPFASAQEGKRYAVLVGVNAYEHDKLETLKYAVNDATELAGVLQQAGYTITLLTDDTGKKDPKFAPTKANIERALKAVGDGAKKGDLVLVGLAGHGVQFESDKDAYFCPSDAKPLKTKSDTLLPLSKVYEELDGCFAGMKVLLVDACRNDPTAGRGVGADTAPRPPQGVAAIFSCKAGQRAFEVEKYKHGVFFHHVLTGLRGEAADKKGRVTFAGLAAHVGAEVPNDVTTLIGGGAVQTPNLKAEYTNEPVLLTRVAAAGNAAAESVAADLRACVRAFDSAEGFTFLEKESPNKLAAWRKSAQDGVAEGQILLAMCLSRGVGVKADTEEAVRLYKKTAEAGHHAAMFELGRMYEMGFGVEKDEKVASEWYAKAANAGKPTAMHSLGYMYQSGRGVPKDPKEAVRWFTKAAEAGDRFSMVGLGLAYSSGNGVEADAQKAVEWYTKGANAGYPFAMSCLGILYELGSGSGPKAVPRDPQKAIEWYAKAAALGDQTAKVGLKRLLKE